MSGPYESLSYHESTISDAKPEQGTISDRSPLGMAIIGHSRGDEIALSSPKDEIGRYRLVDVC